MPGGRPLWQVAGKRDPDQELEAQQWIETIIGERFPPGLTYEDALRNGIILCKLMNRLCPGIITKINTSGGDYKMMDNLSQFQKACIAYGVNDVDLFQTCDLWDRKNVVAVTMTIFAKTKSFKANHLLMKFQKACIAYGVNDVDLFQTCDLWDRKNVVAVTMTIFAIGRTCYKHPEFRGPYLGPRPSEENKREWSEQQLRAGECVIGLQAGTNKGANQSGQNFGASRKIIFGK